MTSFCLYFRFGFALLTKRHDKSCLYNCLMMFRYACFEGLVLKILKVIIVISALHNELVQLNIILIYSIINCKFEFINVLKLKIL